SIFSSRSRAILVRRASVSVDGKAVEQSRAMAAGECLVRAAAADPEGIPGSDPVRFADLCARSCIEPCAIGRIAFLLAGPVVAGVVTVRREGPPVLLRSGQNLMPDGVGMSLHESPGLVACILRRRVARCLLAEFV